MNVGNRYKLTQNNKDILIKSIINQNEVTISSQTLIDYLDSLLLQGFEKQEQEINKYFRLSLLDLDKFLSLPQGPEMFCLGINRSKMEEIESQEEYSKIIVVFYYIYHQARNEKAGEGPGFLTLKEFYDSNLFFNTPELTGYSFII